MIEWMMIEMKDTESVRRGFVVFVKDVDNPMAGGGGDTRVIVTVVLLRFERKISMCE